MFQRRLLRAIVISGLALAFGCNPEARDPLVIEEVSPLVGKPAPAVEGTLLDESKFSLQEQTANNVVMLDFWASWCPPCVAELPILIKLSEEYRSKGVVLFAVNQEEDAEAIRKFLKANNWNLNVVLDVDGKHASAYAVDGIPQLAIIGRDGIVKRMHVGFREDIEMILRRDLDAILAEPPPPAAPPAKPGS